MIATLNVFIFLFGLIIGSFLNCLIWRLYKDETLSGRSYCPHCRKMIAWYDNIPVLSFIILGGRCRHCREKISWQYPLVELVTASLFLEIFWLDQAVPLGSLFLLRDLLFTAGMIVIFVYDFRWQMIPMLVIWPLAAIVLVSNLLLGLSPLAVVIGGAAGLAFFALQYLLTKKKGVGEGDIWLGLLLGFFFADAGKLLLLLVLAYGVGAIISLILMSSRRKKWHSRIALGPFLAFAAIITLIWGEPIIGWYLGLFPLF